MMQFSGDPAFPRWKLCVQYFLYYGVLGCVVPYWALFLVARGFDAHEVGVLVGLFGAARIFFPTLWGALADRAVQRKGMHAQDYVYRFAILFSFLGFFPLVQHWSFFITAIIVLVYGASWSGLAPLMETRCLRLLAGDMGHYGGVRLWGSVGFLVMVLASGQLFDWVPIETYLPYVMLLGLLLLFAMSLSGRADPSILEGAKADTQRFERKASSWVGLLKNKQVWTFLLTVLLMSLSHGPFYTFLAVYLENLGYSKGAIGLFWALSVVSEIIAFSWLRKATTLPRNQVLMGIAVVAAMVRWCLMLIADQGVWIIAIAQCLHAATFGLMHVASLSRVHELFQGPHHSKGQGLYSSLGLAAGASGGAFWSGFSWATWGAQGTFLISALIAFMALIVLVVSGSAKAKSFSRRVRQLTPFVAKERL